MEADLGAALIRITSTVAVSTGILTAPHSTQGYWLTAEGIGSQIELHGSSSTSTLLEKAQPTSLDHMARR